MKWKEKSYFSACISNRTFCGQVPPDGCRRAFCLNFGESRTRCKPGVRFPQMSSIRKRLADVLSTPLHVLSARFLTYLQKERKCKLGRPGQIYPNIVVSMNIYVGKKLDFLRHGTRQTQTRSILYGCEIHLCFTCLPVYSSH
jgi:hypothetical protein